MLFAQLNGGQTRPVEDSAEAGALQNLACDIGPAVDGVRAARSMPQAMGAFVTAGAQGACGMPNLQQHEQHTSTTMHSLGQAAVKAFAPPSPSASTRFSTTSRFAPFPLPGGSSAPVTDPMAVPEMPSTGLPTSATGTYPAGSITAFSSKTGMWRVAIPTGTSIAPATPAAGLAGFFGLGAAPFTEVAAQPSPPAGTTQTTEGDFEQKTGTEPFFKKPLFWVAVGGGALVLIGGGVLLFRRKPAPAPAALPARAAYY